MSAHRMRSLTAVIGALCLTGMAVPALASAAPAPVTTAYVTNTGPGTVFATFDTPTAPTSLVISSNGSTAYVTSKTGGDFLVTSVSTGAFAATIATGTSADGVALTPDGGEALVTNRGSNDVSVIDLDDNTVAATIAVGKNPSGIALAAC